MAPFIPSSLLRRSQKIYQVQGANTDVGKTIFSTLLALSLHHRRPHSPIHYLKPVSTGPSTDADDFHIRRFVPRIASASSLYQFRDPISPHLVTQNPPSDNEVLSRITSHIAAKTQAEEQSYVIVETAGGVHSPTLSGSSQADLYRPLRLPSLLIGDSRLGGISSTISAFESLHIRGYDVAGVLLFRDAVYRNHEYLREYFMKHGISTTAVPAPPERNDNEKEDMKELGQWYHTAAESSEMEALVETLDQRHSERLEKLNKMSQDAVQNIWYPFTQHTSVNKDTITVIDSAHGDFFHALSPSAQGDESLLEPMFDASASWWTQGLGHGNPDLALAVAHAAGRYGHVIFAGTVHEPAIELAKLLLETHSPDGRLSRVFYSDDGSTGCEVAIKMGLRAARERFGPEAGELEVLGLKGSYHGDTIGAMDAAEPGTYNKEVEWYRGRGYWFDFPTVGMTKGRWTVKMPEELSGEVVATAGELKDIFDLERRMDTEVGKRYRRHILETLQRLSDDGRRFGTLLMEPIVLGAGGMLFCDPLFQATLIQVVRENPGLFGSEVAPTSSKDWSGLPVIYDEVFTGLYRLGPVSPSLLLQQPADISVHGKLLTGGLVPLAATLASESIFEAFLSDEKKDALLHGHSYTAHPVGCQVARYAVSEMQSMEKQGRWNAAKTDWRVGEKEEGWSMWGRQFVQELSWKEEVESVWTLGSVLAVHLVAHDGAGYNSNVAQQFLEKLKRNRPWRAHARALGSVVYIMAGQKTNQETIEGMQDLIQQAIGSRGV